MSTETETTPAREKARFFPTQRLATESVFLRIGEDLTYKAGMQARPRVFGREDEADRLIATLTRRYRSNPVILGEPGVGKSVLVEYLAWRIAHRDVPDEIANFKICRTSFPEIWGTVGSSENPWQKYQSLLTELTRACAANPVILFIDEIHVMWMYPLSRNYLKRPISDGTIRVIGATTAREYHRYFTADKAFERRFQPLMLPPPSEKQLGTILRGVSEELENYYAVAIGDEVRSESIRLSDSYLVNRNQPDRALDALETACVVAREKSDENGQTGGAAALVTGGHVRDAVAKLTGVPTEYLGESRKRLEDLAPQLRQRVKGQDDAVEAVAERLLVTKMRLDINPNRPDGVFLFAGPTGVGKTELARAVAHAMTGSDTHLLKLDMANFKDPWSVSLLLGQERGKSEYEEPEPSILTRFAREHPSGVLVLDEIEKAHREVLHLFLSILDDGTFQDRHGNVSWFSFVTIILTTNLGFGTRFRYTGARPAPAPLQADEIQQEAGALKVIANELPKELLGRIDQIIFFKPLSFPVMADLVRQRLRILSTAVGAEITLREMELREIVRRAEESGLGARALDRVVEDVVGKAVARMILRGEIEPGANVRVRVAEGEGAAEVELN